MFLELLDLGEQCEQRITESLTELLLELYSVIWVEEFPNRNCFGITLVIILCVMVQISRSQEKGVLAKGVSAESSVTPKETKIPRGIGPSSTFGTQSATAERRTLWQKPHSKNPLFLVPEIWSFQSSTAKLRIWTLRIWGFRGPGFRSDSCSVGTRHAFFSINFLRNQRQRDDNKNKTCAFEGGGPRGQRGKLSKKTVFRGKRHDNKILKVIILLSRNLLSLRRLLRNLSI